MEIEGVIEPMNVGNASYDDIVISLKKKKYNYKIHYYNRNSLLSLIHIFFIVTGLIGLVLFVLLFSNWKKINKLKELNEKLREDISDINEENIVIESQYKEKFDDVTSFSETIEEYRSRCETRMTEIKDIQTKIESINKEVKRIKKEGRIVEDEIKRFNQLI